MASHWFNNALQKMAAAYMVSGADIRVALCMTSTNAHTANDGINSMSGLTLDECDGANYVRKALANEASNVDDGNDRAEFDSDDPIWTSLGAGTRQTKGALVYKHVTNDADSIPLFWVEFTSPVTHDGNDWQIGVNAEGWAQVRVGT